MKERSNMTDRLLKCATVAAIAAGMMIPQAAPAEEKGYHLGDVDRQARRRGFGYDPDMMRAKLDLNRTQNGQANYIFHQTDKRNEPLKASLEENGKALHKAFDQNNYSAIRSLTDKQNWLMNKMVANYADAKIQFYRILTPEQRVKADKLNSDYRRHIEGRDRPHGLG